MSEAQTTTNETLFEDTCGDVVAFQEGLSELLHPLGCEVIVTAPANYFHLRFPDDTPVANENVLDVIAVWGPRSPSPDNIIYAQGGIHALHQDRIKALFQGSGIVVRATESYWDPLDLCVRSKYTYWAFGLDTESPDFVKLTDILIGGILLIQRVAQADKDFLPLLAQLRKALAARIEEFPVADLTYIY